MPRDGTSRRALAHSLEPTRRPPPRHLSREAKALWREITSDRPPDFFRAGAWPLLARYCTLHAEAARIEGELVALAVGSPEHKLVAELHIKTAAACATLATKLRLAVQHDYRRDSRRVAERRADDEALADDDLMSGEEAGWAFPTTARN